MYEYVAMLSPKQVHCEFLSDLMAAMAQNMRHTPLIRLQRMIQQLYGMLINSITALDQAEMALLERLRDDLSMAQTMMEMVLEQAEREGITGAALNTATLSNLHQYKSHAVKPQSDVSPEEMAAAVEEVESLYELNLQVFADNTLVDISEALVAVVKAYHALPARTLDPVAGVMQIHKHTLAAAQRCLNSNMRYA